MQTKRTIFPNKGLPWLLIAPQMIVTAIFFLWPAAQAIWTSFRREDPFGLNTTFVGLANYTRLFESGEWLRSAGLTAVFATSVTLLAMVASLALALAANRVIRGAHLYTTMLVWPYAVAPVVAGVLWWFLFNPTIGILPMVLSHFGINWNHRINGPHAMALIVIAATWKQVSYNFLFFLAALQSVPKSLIEAAAIDGAGPFKRMRDIVLPLISPTTFFLLIVNINYAMFDTFAIVDATTSGGPAGATNTLVYKVFADGFLGLNLGSSSAQSVVLMAIVIALTFVQFRYVERKVQYG